VSPLLNSVYITQTQRREMALNNKVRNRFFHVTQFTMPESGITTDGKRERKERETERSLSPMFEGNMKKLLSFPIHNI
jgi:hypothetical protein